MFFSLGGLVKKILETKKELEGAHQTEKIAKTEVVSSLHENVFFFCFFDKVLLLLFFG